MHANRQEKKSLLLQTCFKGSTFHVVVFFYPAVNSSKLLFAFQNKFCGQSVTIKPKATPVSAPVQVMVSDDVSRLQSYFFNLITIIIIITNYPHSVAYRIWLRFHWDHVIQRDT